MVKYLLGLTMVLSLVGVVIMAMLAMNYAYIGWGLHPAAAAAVSALLLACGYTAARLLGDE